MSDLNLRARKILRAVIAEYLSTGEAVGSRTITRRHGIDLSAATVRNVMSDLEELGLLDQPHTSAGRLPTDSGLRFYVDSLLKLRSLSPKEKAAIEERFDDSSDIEAIMTGTSRLLSEITAHAGLVLTPVPNRQRFEHIEFVPLKNNKVIGVLVTTGGAIENKLFDLPVELSERQLERIHNYLNELLSGLTLEEIRARVAAELCDERNRYDDMVTAALRLSEETFFGPPATADLIVSGQANLLDAYRAQDEAQLERMRDLLQALEDKELLVRLLDQVAAGHGVQVFLGAEITAEALGQSSVVARPYGPASWPLGAIAVVGPKRMNYGKIMSIVDFTATLVTRLLDGENS